MFSISPKQRNTPKSRTRVRAHCSLMAVDVGRRNKDETPRFHHMAPFVQRVTARSSAYYGYQDHCELDPWRLSNIVVCLVREKFIGGADRPPL